MKVYMEVKDFLEDDKFIMYVLDAAHSNASYWEKLLNDHTELQELFVEAKSVLLASSYIEAKLTQTESSELKQRIFKTIEIENSDY